MSTLASGAALADTVTFDDLKTGTPPPGWTATKTGKSEPKWEHHFIVTLDGKKALEWDDETFKDAGKWVFGPRPTALPCSTIFHTAANNSSVRHENTRFTMKKITAFSSVAEIRHD